MAGASDTLREDADPPKGPGVSCASGQPEKAVPHLSERELLAWRGMLEVHGRLMPALDEELRQAVDLSLSEFDVLYQLWMQPGGRLRMKHLAAVLLITPGGVTRIVSRLEAEGLVRRVSRPGEQAVDAELTPKAVTRLARAMDVHFAGVKTMFAAVLADDEAEILAALWSRIRAAPGRES
jgi:DNA-binding MarR family transcriptional regulator